MQSHQPALATRFSAFCRTELGLSRGLTSCLPLYFQPVAQFVAQSQAERRSTLVVGLSGGQGAGKTTWARILAWLLEDLGLGTVTLSLDDLYLPLAKRHRLQEKNPGNPYTSIPRGPPGTHDVALGVTTIRALAHSTRSRIHRLPSFDKSACDGQGDRRPRKSWPRFRGRPEVIFLEGWFVGARPLPLAVYNRLKSRFPKVAAFEARFDPGGRFGLEQNRLLQEYRPLFSLVDLLIYLKVPALEASASWRQQQERKLVQRTGTGMSPKQVRAFVKPFLLLTAVHGLGFLADPRAGAADLIVELGQNHLPRRTIWIKD